MSATIKYRGCLFETHAEDLLDINYCAQTDIKYAEYIWAKCTIRLSDCCVFPRG